VKKLMEKSDCGWEESREHVGWIFDRKMQKGPGKGAPFKDDKGTDSTALIENQWR
jgi:hypothetical protein